MPFKDPVKYRESVRKGAKRWREKNPQHVKEYKARYKASDPYYEKFRHIKQKYGLNREEWLALAEFQEWCCAICQTELTLEDRICVDHCHKTGLIRGLLCNTCNAGIGNLGDDIRRLESAISYLRRHLNGLES